MSNEVVSDFHMTLTTYLVYGLTSEDRQALCDTGNEIVIEEPNSNGPNSNGPNGSNMMERIYKVVKQNRIARKEPEEPCLYAVKCSSSN